MGNVQVFSNLIVFQMAIFFFCLIAYLDGRMGKMLCSCWLLHHIGALSVVDLSTASWARGNFAVVLESAHNPNCLVCKLASQGRVCSRNASPCKQKKKKERGSPRSLTWIEATPTRKKTWWKLNKNHHHLSTTAIDVTQDYFEFGNRLSWCFYIFKKRCCLVLNELASSASFRNVSCVLRQFRVLSIYLCAYWGVFIYDRMRLQNSLLL